MGPKNPRTSSPKATSSPVTKKPKTGSAKDAGVAANMAAPMNNNNLGASNARRSLELGSRSAVMDTESNDKAPTWFTQFEVRLEQFLESKIISRLNDLTTKVTEHDEKLDAVNMDVSELKSQVKALQKEKASLTAKVDDIENRSRRNNLVFYGVPESGESCADTMKDVFQFAGLNMEIPMERCHRTPTVPRNDNRDKPRMIHIAFQSFSTKEMVRKECIRKFKSSEYKGKKIFVDDDFSDRIRRLRREKMDKFKQLKSENKKPFFVYPAQIRYREETTGRLVTVD